MPTQMFQFYGRINIYDTSSSECIKRLGYSIVFRDEAVLKEAYYDSFKLSMYEIRDSDREYDAEEILYITKSSVSECLSGMIDALNKKYGKRWILVPVLPS